MRRVLKWSDKVKAGRKVRIMSKLNEEQFTWPQAFIWAFAVIAILASSVLMADESSGDAEMRTSVSSFYSQQGRSQLAPDKISEDELAPFATSETRDKTALQSSKADSGVSTLSAPNIEFWFYSADVELFGDNDRDGYFAGIDLLFDADTVYSRAEVYAIVYLSLEGGPWTEYAATDDFIINGTSGTDEYVIVTDLVSGYPSGSYDILIELFDTFDNSFVADIGPENTSELAFLPLEDANRDAPGVSPQPTVINHGGGGGATDVWTLAILAFVAAGTFVVRRRRLPYSGSLQPAQHRGPSA
jgi:hypothetical protein